MKTCIKKILCLLCLLVFIFFNSKSQNIIKYDNDTLITLTPNNIKTINCIIVDFENTKDQLNLYKRLSKQDSILINQKDSILRLQNNLMIKKENYYNSSISNLKENLNKEKNKKNLWIGILSGVSILLGILVISK